MSRTPFTGGLSARTFLYRLVLLSALAVPISGQAQWEWSNPLPQGSSLEDVHFVDDDTGWAVGWGSTVLRTTDGGATWDILQQGQVNGIPHSGRIIAVHFADTDNGWMTVEANSIFPSSILRTSDGGESWSVQWQPQAPRDNDIIYLNDIYFADESTGWVVGTAVNQTDYLVLLRTTDGGDTWEDLSTTPGAPAANELVALEAVHFLDAEHGWIAGGKDDYEGGAVWRTDDGGDSWTKLPLPVLRVMDVHFTDKDTGYAINEMGFFSQIWFTGDGGENWALQTELNKPLVTITFADADNGYASGGVPADPVFLRTTDGGATWVEEPVPFAPYGLSFTGTGAGTMVGANGGIARTGDGGASWEPQWETLTPARLFGVTYLDAQTALALGEGGTILRSMDGGATWSPVSSGTQVVLVDADFPDPQTGFAVGGANGIGSILRSQDGGLSWTTLPVGTVPGILAVSFVDSQTGWVAGEQDAVLHTADGGDTWISRAVGNDDFWNDVHFVDENTGWVAGFSGVHRTTDGGVTWQQQLDSPVERVQFVDADTGWAASGATILHTTDGGDNWNVQLVAPSTVLDIHFADAEHGAAVGGPGMIIRTTDGGATWSQKPWKAVVRGVALSPDVGGIAVGGDQTAGFILHRADNAPPEGLVIHPNLLDFGTVDVGDVSGSFQVTLAATGPDPVLLTEIPSPAPPFLFQGGNCGVPPVTLSPGESCELAYQFAPDAAIASSGGVVIGNDAANDPLGIVMYGTGGVDTGAMELTPSMLRFGEMEAGSASPPQVATLHNTGDFALTGLVFGRPSHYLVDSGDCGTSLPVGQSCEVVITFVPAAPGQHGSIFTASSAEGATADLRLSGTGVEPVPAPRIEIEPEALSIELAAGEQMQAPLVISSTGNATLEWQIVEEIGLGGRVLRASRYSPVPLDTLTPAHSPSAYTLPSAMAAGRGNLVRGPDGIRDMTASSHPFVAADEMVTVTHSQSLDVVGGNSVTCADGTSGNTLESQFLRVFVLSHFGIINDFEITEVQFGVEVLNTDAEISVNLYTLEGLFVYPSLTLIGSAGTVLSPQTLSLISVPVSATAPAGSTLVVEIVAPGLDGAFFPGFNTAGETAPSYFASSFCGMDNPVTFESIGYPDAHLVMTVTGESEPVDCSLPDWLEPAPVSGTVPAGANEMVAVGFDAAGLAVGTYGADMCLVSNDPGNSVIVVPVELMVTNPVNAIFSDRFEPK